MGLEAVSDYIGLLDVFTDFVFIPERISQGETGVCLTWRCEVNGQDGPSGISFNEINSQGKIAFARDIPAPAWPRPVGRLAALLLRRRQLSRRWCGQAIFRASLKPSRRRGPSSLRARSSAVPGGSVAATTGPTRASCLAAAAQPRLQSPAGR